MSTGPLSHPGNNPPRPDPCPACRGNGYVIEMWDRPGGPPGNQVMACERCNPPRRAVRPDNPRAREETRGNPPLVRRPALPILHVACPRCDGLGKMDIGIRPQLPLCPDCGGLGRIPTAAGRAILEFLEYDWPKQEDRP